MKEKINIVILGASGYTGAELIRLLLGHPHVEIKALTAESQAGQPLAEIFPHLAHAGLPDPVKIDAVDFKNIGLVFCCLPHGTTQAIIAGLPQHVRIVDLSADFRLHDLETYARWYGHAHQAPALQKDAVYGLTEHHRREIKSTRLVANPGCYPTASCLPLIPLLKEKLISSAGIIIDAKSGVSGAGRSVKRNLLFSEIDEGMSAYSVGGHRHLPEIEQELSLARGENIQVNFTPHLIPMRRGMIATIYAKLTGSATVADADAALKKTYAGEPFIAFAPPGQFPSTHNVRGSNLCQIGVYKGRSADDVILISAIDNLTKGASGQAVQNMNVMHGWPETLGLEGGALFP